MKVFLTLFTLLTCCVFAQEEMQIEKVGSCGCADCKCTPENHCGCMAKPKPKPKCDCKEPSCPCNRKGHSNDYDDDADDADDADDKDRQDRRGRSRSRW